MDRYEFYSNLQSYQKNSLEHYGVLGQKWGKRRWQNADGTFNAEGKIRYFGPKKNKNGIVFISGSSKTQFSDDDFYRPNLSTPIQDQINRYMKEKKTILVGDAPGIDRQVQDYLRDNRYDDVEIYSPGKETRYSANPNWKVNHIDVPNAEEGSPEWLRGKDEAMTERATEGLAITIEDGALATRNNIERFKSQGKGVDVFELKKDGNDDWDEISEKTKFIKDIRSRGYIIDDDISYNLDDVNSHMHEDFMYDNSDHKLQSPKETLKKSTGNCHDQTLFEMEVLKENGYDPKALFLIEIDPKTGEGGQTHSFVYYNPYGKKTVQNDEVNWFENAWFDKAGIRSYSNLNELKKDIEKDFGSDKNKYTKIIWGNFNGEPGDSLQDIVNKSLK